MQCERGTGQPVRVGDRQDGSQVRPSRRLVNNAGRAHSQRSEAVTDGSWSDLPAVYLDGSFRCWRAAYSALRDSRAGAIVNISSVLVMVYVPKAVIQRRRGDIEGLTQVLAIEWDEAGIRVAPDRNKAGRGLRPLRSCQWTTMHRLGRLDEIAGPCTGSQLPIPVRKGPR